MSTEPDLQAVVVDGVPRPGAGLDEVADAVRDRAALVLTGAGMSTDSGIPDYRGPDGTRRVTPMQYADFRGSSEARRRYWARSFVGWQRMASVRPNAAHLAVTRLQTAGHLGPVITQNVDGLHQAAGTTGVVELHGALRDVVCLTCGDRTRRTDLDARMRSENPGFVVRGDEIRPDGDVRLDEIDVERFAVPLCLVCGQDTLKPDVVFFGDSVPRDRVDHCFALTDATPALVVLGSSLAVMSGYRFVRRAASRGVPVVVVTRGPTRGDAQATHRLDADLSPTLTALADLLGA